MLILIWTSWIFPSIYTFEIVIYLPEKIHQLLSTNNQKKKTMKETQNIDQCPDELVEI